MIFLVVSFIVRYVSNHTLIAVLSRFSSPIVRKWPLVSFENDIILITEGLSQLILVKFFYAFIVRC